MRLFIAFMLLFIVAGMFTRQVGWWGYFIIAGVASVMAGTYMLNTGVW
jgi:hypothetical protein